jgi:DNA-binding NtrC family response regulator
MGANMTYRPSVSDAAPVLIVHLDRNLRRMLVEVFELEGYAAQGVRSGEEALRHLQADKGGMIVYLEVLFLRVVGNEQLHDYMIGREERTPHVFVLFTGSMFTEEDVKRLRADGTLEQPFTVDQALASVEAAQRLLRDKRAHVDDTVE